MKLYAGERLLPVDRVAPCETCPPKSGAVKRDADAVLVWTGENGAKRVHRLCGACLERRYGERWRELMEASEGGQGSLFGGGP